VVLGEMAGLMRLWFLTVFVWLLISNISLCRGQFIIRSSNDVGSRITTGTPVDCAILTNMDSDILVPTVELSTYNLDNMIK
jgi:hypothetical protein